MAAKKKVSAADAIGPRDQGTFEISYKQGNEWIKHSTRYNGMTVGIDVEELESEGKRVRVTKVSDKTAHELDED